MHDIKTRIVIMGCGGSGGVPYAGNVWGKCDPLNPKNMRTRPSVFIERNQTRIVIDTGPDFRTQINKTGLTEPLDAALYTHAHVDHTLGLDDLRSFWYMMGKQPVTVYADIATMEAIKKRFDYAFESLNPNYPATVIGEILPKKLTIGDLDIQSFDQIHGQMTTKGFRVGDFAYSTDLNDLPEEAFKILKGIKVWVVGSHSDEHGTYNHVGFNTIKKWVDRIEPEITYLTHLNAWADYDELSRLLPQHIRPAYDGLEILL